MQTVRFRDRSGLPQAFDSRRLQSGQAWPTSSPAFGAGRPTCDADAARPTGQTGRVATGEPVDFSPVDSLASCRRRSRLVGYHFALRHSPRDRSDFEGHAPCTTSGSSISTVPGLSRKAAASTRSSIPRPRKPVGKILLGTAEDVDAAVRAARAAFESFSQTSREERVALLRAHHQGFPKQHAAAGARRFPMRWAHP